MTLCPCGSAEFVPQPIPAGCDQCVCCEAITAQVYDVYDTCPECRERHCPDCSLGPVLESEGVRYRQCRSCAAVTA